MAKRILIADYDSSFHDIYKAMLKCKDYDIVGVYDGYRAMGSVEQKKPDLIITEMRLTLATGDSFILYLKGFSEFADVPIIVISTYSEKHYKSLKKVDSNLVYIEKDKLNEEILLEEIEKKIGSEI